jgi:hypothetical protein
VPTFLSPLSLLVLLHALKLIISKWLRRHWPTIKCVRETEKTMSVFLNEREEEDACVQETQHDLVFKDAFDRAKKKNRKQVEKRL